MVNCRSSKAVVTNRPFPLVYANPAGGEPSGRPLSGSAAPVSFRAMSQPSTPGIVTGIRVGMVAAAATIGAVIGLGLRHGLALRPMNALGFDLASDPATTMVGLAVVAIAVVVLGVCFTLVAAPLRGVGLLLTATAFAAMGWAVCAYVVPSILTLGSGAVLGTAQRVFVCGMLALALVAGMRLARPEPDTRIE